MLAWYWTDSASDAPPGLPLGVAGHDPFNLFATDVTGNSLVTQNVGVKFKPSRHAEIGTAFEFPLSSNEDILANRLQVDVILRY